MNISQPNLKASVAAWPNGTDSTTTATTVVYPCMLGLASGIPSLVALVLAIILAVTCIRQRMCCSCNRVTAQVCMKEFYGNCFLGSCCNTANQHQEVPEECKYEETIPKLPEAFYISMMKDPPCPNENENRKPPCRLPEATPQKPNWARNIKQGASPAGQQPSTVMPEAIYETCIPTPLTKKKAKSMGWD